MITRLNLKVPTFTLTFAKQRKFLRVCLGPLGVLFLISQFCMAQTAAEPEPAEQIPGPLITSPIPERSERDNQLLARATPEEALWLEAAGQQILALHRPTENATTKGAVLFLHAAETPPGWPPAFENPRRTLPHHGWITLALALPPKAPSPLPQRETPVPVTTAEAATTTLELPPPAQEASAETTSPTEPAPPAATSAELTAPPSRSEQVQQRVDAALAWLGQQNITTIALMVDNSSALESLNRLQNTPLIALILVNLQAQEELTTAELEALFTSTSPPVLDVFLAPHQGQMTATRKRHRAVAQRRQVPLYQQLHLPPPLVVTRDDEKTFWVERLRGFIEKQQKAAAP